jgi:protein-disulfide isomerase
LFLRLTNTAFVAFSVALCLPAGDNTLRLGSPNGGLTIIIYEDLQCSDCSAFQAMFTRSILPRYQHNVEFVFRDFPLEHHAWALKAAIACRFFTEKNVEAGLEFRSWILVSQKRITIETFEGHLRSFAERHGIEPTEAVRALNNSRYRDLVMADIRSGLLIGVKHTPTVIVGRRWLTEAIQSEDLANAIDWALLEPRGGKIQ